MIPLLVAVQRLSGGGPVFTRHPRTAAALSTSTRSSTRDLFAENAAFFTANGFVSVLSRFAESRRVTPGA